MSKPNQYMYVGVDQSNGDIVVACSHTELDRMGYNSKRVSKVLDGERQTYKGLSWTKEVYNEDKLMSLRSGGF